MFRFKLPLLALLVFAPCGALALEAKAPWSVDYADGSGNHSRFSQASEKAPIQYEYSPIRPENSSSGVYSGGAPKQGSIDDSQSKELWAQVTKLAADEKIHIPDRIMGSGAIKIATPAGKQDFIVRDGADLQKFNQFVVKVRDSIAETRPVKTSLPVFPGATQDLKQSGATSLQDGKNFTVAVYMSDKSMDEVVKFYQQALNKTNPSEQIDGLKQFRTPQGTVRISKMGDQTRIQLSEGPQ